MDYYRILNISRTASQEDIKKAFRKKLKIHHPDVNSGTNSIPKHSEKLLHIINAYNVLSSPIKRKYYDARQTYHCIYDEVTRNVNVYTRKKTKIFNYEDFLLSRQNVWNYKIKFFVYDLVFCESFRAVAIYEEIVSKNLVENMRKTLGRLDYFDCLFLVAEYYEHLANFDSCRKALIIYYEIGEIEKEKSYFKSYMEEVAERVLSIIETYYNRLDATILQALLDSMESWSIIDKQKRKIIKLKQMYNV